MEEQAKQLISSTQRQRKQRKEIRSKTFKITNKLSSTKQFEFTQNMIHVLNELSNDIVFPLHKPVRGHNVIEN